MGSSAGCGGSSPVCFQRRREKRCIMKQHVAHESVMARKSHHAVLAQYSFICAGEWQMLGAPKTTLRLVPTRARRTPSCMRSPTRILLTTEFHATFVTNWSDSIGTRMLAGAKASAPKLMSAKAMKMKRPMRHCLERHGDVYSVGPSDLMPIAWTFWPMLIPMEPAMPMATPMPRPHEGKPSHTNSWTETLW